MDDDGDDEGDESTDDDSYADDKKSLTCRGMPMHAFLKMHLHETCAHEVWETENNSLVLQFDVDLPVFPEVMFVDAKSVEGLFLIGLGDADEHRAPLETRGVGAGFVLFNLALVLEAMRRTITTRRVGPYATLHAMLEDDLKKGKKRMLPDAPDGDHL